MRTTLFLLGGVGLGALWLATHTSELSGDGTSKLFFGLWQTRALACGVGLVWLGILGALASRSKRSLRGFLAAHVVFGLLWIALEGAGAAGIVDYAQALRPVPKGKLGTVPVPKADVRGETREDLAAAWGHPSPSIPFHFRTDSRGFRNHVDHEVADVYCLGDSFLVGGLVAWEETLTARLGAALQRPVSNLALNGLSPQEECELFRDSGLDPRGKLVIQFLFEGNDLLDSAHFGTAAQESRASFKDRSLTNNLILKLQDLTQPAGPFLALRSGRIDGETFLFRWTREAFARHEPEVHRITATLSEFRDEIEAAGGRYAIVMIPSKLRILGPLAEFPPSSPLRDVEAHCSPLPGRIAEFCAAESIPYLDLTEPLAEAARAGELPWFAGDTHWNAVGNRVAAQAVLGFEPVRALARESSQ